MTLTIDRMNFVVIVISQSMKYVTIIASKCHHIIAAETFNCVYRWLKCKQRYLYIFLFASKLLEQLESNNNNRPR